MKIEEWLSVGFSFVLLVMFLLGSEAWAQEKQTGGKQLEKASIDVIMLPSIEKGGAVMPAEEKIKQEILEQFRLMKKTYSIHGNEFDSYHEKITWASQGGSVNRYVSSCGIAVCGLEAPVHLPDGAHIIGYSCRVVDNSQTHPVGLALIWTKGDGVAYSSSSCFASTSAPSASPSIQSVNNTTCSVPVDNSTWAYAIRFHTYEGGSGATTCEDGGRACRIYNCFVYYY